jgi:UDP-N-acetylmuramyl pentapeptide phosphotransferase/UDP-N-acetylglucosamine-1-phosphate transferase
MYAAYGGVYISVALLWLWLIENQRPSQWDIIGVVVSLIGMSIIILDKSEKVRTRSRILRSSLSCLPLCMIKGVTIRNANSDQTQSIL